MATYYSIDFGSNGTTRLGRSFDFEEAREFVERGGDVWTRYMPDAEKLAETFEVYELDDIHFDLHNHPGVRFTLAHFHVGDRKIRRRPHICFGDAFNDHNQNHILVIK